MAFPPRAQVGPAVGSTAAEIGPLMAEQIPAPAAFVNKRDIVHFDMDPQNIFLFDSDANHRRIPVFKVSFFPFLVLGDFVLLRGGESIEGVSAYGFPLAPLGSSDTMPFSRHRSLYLVHL